MLTIEQQYKFGQRVNHNKYGECLFVCYHFNPERMVRQASICYVLVRPGTSTEDFGIVDTEELEEV